MKICILGCIAWDKEMYDGQTIKTQNLINGLADYSGNEIYEVDTYKWKEHPFRLLKQILKGLRECEAFIMLAASNGIAVFLPLLVLLNSRFHKKIFYDVVGGWLPQWLDKKMSYLSFLKKYDGIWVETTSMKKKLNALGLDNICIMPNYKILTVLDEKELVLTNSVPYKLCTFSRVMKNKGIERAISAVSSINEKNRCTVYTLDIYGKVDESERDWFEKLKSDFPEYITYKGVVPSSESVNVIKNYFAVLFPTLFYTEGIPGTIIDAYCAGVPVIASKWENYADIIIENVTGVCYEFDDESGLENILLEIKRNPYIIAGLKNNCLEKGKDYTADNVVVKIMNEINHANF